MNFLFLLSLIQMDDSLYHSRYDIAFSIFQFIQDKIDNGSS